jgi:acyl-CoA synthetase (AMP-forming)/AMP-acid ligase II
VIAQLSNSPVFAALFAGLAVRGVALLPVHTQWSAAQVAQRLAGKQVAGVVTDAELASGWSDEPAFSHVPRVNVGGVDAPHADCKGSEPVTDGDVDALCLLTSATTGPCKLVVRTQAQLLANAENVSGRLGWEPGCRVLPVTPFFHANGFSNGLLLPLLSGACVVLMAQYFPARLVELIARCKVQVLLASPVVYSTLVRSPNDGAALSSLQLALSSGAPLSPTVIGLAAERGIGLRELYGSSETGTISIGTPGGSTVGRPLDRVQVRIQSDTGDEVGPGELGQVAVRGPAVMKGYWTRDGIDPARDAHGFYLTGDLGRLSSESELSLHGRLRKYINVGGSKVSPEQVERVLACLPGVVRCRVDGEPHPELGEQVAATVVVRPESEIGASDVLAYCRGRLSEYEIPRRISIEIAATPELPDKYGGESP